MGEMDFCVIPSVSRPRVAAPALGEGGHFIYYRSMEIVILGNDVLRQKAAPVADINTEIKDLANRMIETMIRGKGIGLAAPQVGLASRLFVVGIDGDVPRVFINPSLLETSEDQSDYEEGCLSIPGVYSKVSRSSNIRIQAWNERGRPFTLDADGLLARVILHEYDHLEGMLFIDRLSEMKRNRLISQYEKRMRA